MSPTRVMLVDDHAIVRRGLAALLSANENYSIVAEARDGEEALNRLETTVADVVLLDLFMPRMGGMETIRRIRRKFPQVKIVVLSMYDDEQLVAQALHD